MATERFDLVVIGSGPAGEKGAVQAAYFGKRVALIEKEPVLGGTGTNTGTLPSKTLRETALFLSGFQQRELFGLRVGLKDKVTVRDFLARERFVVDNERARILENLRRHKVTQYVGTAAFVDPHTIAVRPARCPEFLVEGAIILIATGSYPYRPPVLPFHDPFVYDSDTILTLQEIPTSLLVLGGGVIGCEYACMFNALGVKVTLVEKRERLLDFLDAEMSEALRRQMESSGIRVLLSNAVEDVQSGDMIEARLKTREVIQVQTILVSAGRCGNTEALGLSQVGIAVDDRGRIKVNDSYQTTLPHVYAAGDVIGNPALASTSMEQARVAMVNAFQLEFRSGVSPILPYGIYTIPELSMVGETEESLTAAKTPYVIGKASYGDNARGQIIGDCQGFLKLLFHEEDMRLLGVHLIGEQATEIVHLGLAALLMKAGADLFIQTCFNYPTLTEVYKYATYDALGRRAKKKPARKPKAPAH
jgi:NAD(P) transhydrogenase